ncbi:hypothetical protein FACS189490_01160 [Clostridia bacterium]|nr:hypothetical protein FACS189490_01160 [Clostridia bacterium]
MGGVTTTVLTETHLHTAEVSICAVTSAKDIAEIYTRKDYGKIVVTDHYNPWTLDELSGTIKEKNDKWLNGYRILKESGQAHGIDVFLGMEITLDGTPEDFLIYGFDEEIFKEYDELYKLSLEELYTLATEWDMLVVQAHPFRDYKKFSLKPHDPRFLHGIEVFNGSKAQNNNDKARDFAIYNKKIKTAGSDFHFVDDAATAGIYIPEEIKTNKDFTAFLRTGEAELYRGGNQ